MRELVDYVAHNGGLDFYNNVAQTVYVKSFNNQYTTDGIIIYVKPMYNNIWYVRIEGTGLGCYTYTYDYVNNTFYKMNKLSEY